MTKKQPVAAVKATKTIEKEVSPRPVPVANARFMDMGRTDANDIKEAANKAETFKRNLLLKRAEEMTDAKQISAYLFGYGEETDKFRKGEAKAIFEAYAVNKEAVKSFEGGYHELIKLCRDIRGEVQQETPAGTRADNRRQRTRKISDTSFSKEVKTFSAFTPVQRKEATTALIKEMQSDLEYLRVAEGALNMLTVSSEKFISDLANKLLPEVSSAIERLTQFGEVGGKLEVQRSAAAH